MKIQVKTLSQKDLMIDIDGTKAVYDLKKELSLMSEVGVPPEFQKLIYAGKVLGNSEILKSCIVDASKFLVIMTDKHLVTKQQESCSSSISTSTTSTIPTDDCVRKTTEVKNEKKQDEKGNVGDKAKVDPEALVKQITSMGYVESDVRGALQLSFNCPERAIQYLIEGKTAGGKDADGTTKDAPDVSVFQLFRHDPVFREMRHTIRQNPDLMYDAVTRLAEANPIFMTMINQNREQFTQSLLNTFENDSDDEEGH